MLDYGAASAVAMIVRTGSFEKAAKALHVTPSAISQRVKQLEERMGTILVERGSPCRATDKGAWLCRHMELVGQLENDLFGQLPELGEVKGGTVTVDVAVNADSLGTWFLPAMAAFAQHSNVMLSIAVDDQDHTAEWLRRGRVLAAVTSMSEPVSGCTVTALGHLRYVATASPEFCRRYFPDGVTGSALNKAPTLAFNQKDSMQQDWLAEHFASKVAPPTHWLPSTQGFVEACVLGMGWCLNPIDLVQSHIDAGRLVELVPGATTDVPLYWQISRWAEGRFPELKHQIIDWARASLF
ncbi:LysR family transcriptional regulator ArgP [Pelagibacterium xiamenense]|uniref:LysR family transcriptional regulator ArgP n=1 Tax=Pelagibacterium xiamenense TaxID=2901140 RepID=UPI001E2BDBD8|nr:LysR family transcriptional regulator ArgP [Pelagibacterium xiamenense]MCD7059859.1 LysR family transcriptional regulator ArgP [Pelagibacterium xiamenense]